MQLTLEPDEAEILRDVLTVYLSDLRAEIYKTESYETRRELHRREDVLKKIIEQLRQPTP
ncbi:MAG: hypothetical protein C4290_05535 [Chloroflexota bacterium]